MHVSLRTTMHTARHTQQTDETTPSKYIYTTTTDISYAKCARSRILSYLGICVICKHRLNIAGERARERVQAIARFGWSMHDGTMARWHHTTTTTTNGQFIFSCVLVLFVLALWTADTNDEKMSVREGGQHQQLDYNMHERERGQHLLSADQM